MLKTGQEMREKRKKEMDQQKEMIAQMRNSDPEKYLQNLYQQRKEILERMSER